MSGATAKKRVIIVGAGLGGLSAAWYLSKHRKHDVEVVVYEASWVPGGKAVSGRAYPEPPPGTPHVIEEHGLHMLFGTYHEAWRMLSDCYSELDRPVSHAFRHIEQAFTPQRRIVFDQRARSDDPRQHWVFCPVEHDGRPWDAAPADGGADDINLLNRVPSTIEANTREMVATAIELYGPAIRSFEVSRQQGLSKSSAFGRTGFDTREIRTWTLQIAQLWSPVRISSLCLSQPWITLEQLLRLATSARQIEELLDLGFAILDGTHRLKQECTCVAERKRCQCLDRLNGVDLRAWLKEHGWNPENDAIVRGFYAGLFALEGELAAGVGLRAILRVLSDYKGAMVYRMESGMGEVVIAPVYLALRKQNVQFHFLNRLASLEVSGGRLSKLHFERLGKLPDGYEPHRTTTIVHGELEYFPNAPPTEVSLRNPPKGEFHRMHRRWPTSGTKHSLELDDGDHVILAIPPKVLNDVAVALKERKSWKAFLDGASATRSRPIGSVQVWRTVPGDRDPSPLAGAVAAGHQRPFEDWADVSHVLSREGSPHDATELSYLCGAREGNRAATQSGELRRVDQQTSDWLETESEYMLGRVGDEVRRYVAASLAPSDEYILSYPDTIEHRIRPGETGFTNLSVAGDWVKNGLDCGCVESAVTGGILAAKSIP